MTNLEKSYEIKDRSYFENVRHDVLKFLPEFSDTVMEVGCGTGETLAYLKAAGRCRWAIGVEFFHDAAEKAKDRLDLVIEGNIENLSLPVESGTIDVILCLDVLEHLVDPWSIVHRLHSLLKTGGVLVVSIPNVRNFRVIFPLLLMGKWEYQECGILDKTHLRFFTKASAMSLVSCSGLRIEQVEPTGLKQGGKAALANALTLSLFKSFLEFQYIIKARRID